MFSNGLILGIIGHPPMHFQKVFGRYLWNGPSTLKIEENKLHFFSILGLDESQRRNYCRRSIGKLLGIMVPGYFVLTNMRISFTYSHCLKMFHVSLYIAVNCTVTITLRAGERYFEMKLVIRFWPTSAYSPLHYFVLCFLRCLFKVPDCVHE